MNKEKEFEEKILNKLLVDLKDIDKYKSFKNGSFIYDLGYYQGNLLINEIARLNNIIKEAREYIEKYLEREYFDTDILETNTIYNKDLFKVKQILDKENNK